MDSLYETDFIAWTEQQGRLLRAAQAAGSNLDLDWDNLIEEVEALGRSQLRDAAGELRKILWHLLLLEAWPASAKRGKWLDTLDDVRADLEIRLRHDPGLAPRLPALMARSWCDVVRMFDQTAPEYEAQDGPATNRVVARIRNGASYPLADVLGEWRPDNVVFPIPYATAS